MLCQRAPRLVCYGCDKKGREVRDIRCVTGNIYLCVRCDGSKIGTRVADVEGAFDTAKMGVLLGIDVAATCLTGSKEEWSAKFNDDTLDFYNNESENVRIGIDRSSDADRTLIETHRDRYVKRRRKGWVPRPGQTDGFANVLRYAQDLEVDDRIFDGTVTLLGCKVTSTKIPVDKYVREKFDLVESKVVVKGNRACFAGTYFVRIEYTTVRCGNGRTFVDVSAVPEDRSTHSFRRIFDLLRRHKHDKETSFLVRCAAPIGFVNGFLLCRDALDMYVDDEKNVAAQVIRTNLDLYKTFKNLRVATYAYADEDPGVKNTEKARPCFPGETVFVNGDTHVVVRLRKSGLVELDDGRVVEKGSVTIVDLQEIVLLLYTIQSLKEMAKKFLQSRYKGRGMNMTTENDEFPPRPSVKRRIEGSVRNLLEGPLGEMVGKAHRLVKLKLSIERIVLPMSSASRRRFESDIETLFDTVEKPPCLLRFLTSYASPSALWYLQATTRTGTVDPLQYLTRMDFPSIVILQSDDDHTISEMVKLVRKALQIFENADPSRIGTCGLGIGLLSPELRGDVSDMYDAESPVFFCDGNTPSKKEVAYVRSDAREVYVATDRFNELTYVSKHLRQSLRRETPKQYVFDLLSDDAKAPPRLSFATGERPRTLYCLLRHFDLKSAFGDVIDRIRKNAASLFDEPGDDILRLIFLCSLSESPHVIFCHVTNSTSPVRNDDIYDLSSTIERNVIASFRTWLVANLSPSLFRTKPFFGKFVLSDLFP